MTTFDVAVIGAGPSGLMIANLLGQAGISVLLVERNPSTVQEPRAVSIDDESLRTIQAAGLIDDVLRDVALDYGSHYFTRSGVCFAKVEPTTREYGYPRRNAFRQPTLEAALRQGLARYANVTTMFQTSCEAVAETEHGVTLTLRNESPETRSVQVRYVAACDGSRSALRRTIGATLAGSTYSQRWLIVDLAETRELFRQTRVMCNPARPALTLPGPSGTRRYEFMLQDREDDDRATSDDFVHELLEVHGPDAGCRIVRKAVYAFHARIVDRWQSERIFLAGDAAHLSPPFAGQGMNSGLRDAHNLAWKLAAVVRGQLGAGLLRTYQQERAPHAQALIDLAVNMGRVMMPTSPLQAALVQTGFRAAALFPPVRDYFSQMKYKPKPYYREGFVGTDDGLGVVGRMMPQPLIETGAARMLADELAGNEFALLAYGPNAVSTLRRAAGIDFGRADLRRLAIVPARQNPGALEQSGAVAGRDVEDRLASVLPPGADYLVLQRPDRYAAAAIRVTRDDDLAGFASQVARLIAGVSERDGSRGDLAA